MRWTGSDHLSCTRGARAAAVGFLLAALSTTVAGSSAARAGGSEVRLRERDFTIAGPKLLHAGTVTFLVRNQGPDDHELIVARSEGGHLPFRSDGLTIDEDALEQVTAGALEPGWPGTTRRLRVTLARGRYVLFCNMAGHYLGGMHLSLLVR